MACLLTAANAYCRTQHRRYKVNRQSAGLCSLGMKINAKLGGINVRLAGSQQEAMPHIGRKPVMFLGKLLLPAQRGGHMVRLFSADKLGCFHAGAMQGPMLRIQ